METTPALARAPEETRAVLADKIHRPFARCGLSLEERIDLLILHYEVAQQTIEEQALLSLVSGQKFVLARLINPKDGQTYAFTLCREMISQHQGEFSFYMISEGTEIPFAMLMANLGKDKTGKRTLFISGIQGPVGNKSGVVRLTRDLNGLRPKRAILEAAYAFAKAIKIRRIIATAKANHVSQTKAKWQRKIHAEYDPFWQEFNPTVLPDGDFDMPLILPSRTAEDVPSKKRKNWIARQELLASIETQTAQALMKIAPAS